MIRAVPLWPRRRWWWFLGVASFVAMFLGTLPVYGWGPPQWRELTSSSREATLLVSVFSAPICAAIPRVLTSRSVVAGPAAARANQVLTSHLLRISAAIASGTTAAILVAVVALVSGADGGAPDVLSLVGVLLAVVAVGSISYTASAMLPQRAGGVIAAVGAVLAAFIPPLINPLLAESGRSSRQPSFVWLNEFPLIGWEVTTQTSVLRIVLFLTIIVSCWAVSIARVKRPFGPRIIALGSAVTAVCMAVVAVAVSPPLVQPERAEAVCDRSGTFDVCLHPNYVTLTGRVRATASRVLEVAPGEHRPNSLQQTGTSFDADDYLVRIQLERVESDQDLESAVIVPISLWVSGAPACQARSQAHGGSVVPEGDAESYDIQHALALTIQERLGLEIHTGRIAEDTGQMVRPPALEALAALDGEALREWMQRVSTEIEQCALTADLLP